MAIDITSGSGSPIQTAQVCLCVGFNIFRFLYYLKREPLGDFLLGLSLGPYLDDHLT